MMTLLVTVLGLLKKLVSDAASCQNLMSLCVEEFSLMTCLKKLLLSNSDVLQTSVCQILEDIVEKQDFSIYGPAILESDLLGMFVRFRLQLLVCSATSADGAYWCWYFVVTIFCWKFGNQYKELQIFEKLLF